MNEKGKANNINFMNVCSLLGISSDDLSHVFIYGQFDYDDSARDHTEEGISLNFDKLLENKNRNLRSDPG